MTAANNPAHTRWLAPVQPQACTAQARQVVGCKAGPQTPTPAHTKGHHQADELAMSDSLRLLSCEAASGALLTHAAATSASQCMACTMHQAGGPQLGAKYCIYTRTAAWITQWLVEPTL